MRSALSEEPIRDFLRSVTRDWLLIAACAISLAGSLVLSVPAFGQVPLNLEETISIGDPSEVSLRVFHPGLVYVAYIEDNLVRVQSGPQFGSAVTLGAGLDQSWPVLSISLSGALSVYFEQVDPTGTGSGVFRRMSLGGNFTPSVEVDPDFAPDRRPTIASYNGFGTSSIAWTRVNGGTPFVHYSDPSIGVQAVDEGEDPNLAFFVGASEELVYLRNGGVIHRSGVSGVWGPDTTISGALAPSEPRVAVDALGAVHVTFLSGGQVWYVRRPAGGGFTAPIEVTPGVFDIEQAEIAVEPTGIVQILYASAGDIWLRSGAVGFFGPTMNLTGSPTDPEDHFSAGIDTAGSIHLVYRRQGLLRYRNNIPPPAASFTVSPAVGEAPHAVAFSDTSTGEIENRIWEFGDGETSTEESPQHIYETAGSYTVTLSLVGPGGVDATTIQGAVTVSPPENVVRIPAITVIRSQPGITIPVYATHPDPLQGYQIGLRWDPTVFLYNEATIVGTVSEPLLPDFLIINPLDGPNGVEGLTMGVVFDTIPPLDGRVIPPGIDQRLVHVNVDVLGTAPADQISVIEFDDTIGDPPILNIFTVAGVSKLPFQIDGQVLVVPLSFPPPILFLRGDFDNDLQVAINDAVAILAYLFAGGAPPGCVDSADVNDTGTIDLSDPVNLLNFLFTGSNQPPPYPWPTPGADPTDDPLGGC